MTNPHNKFFEAFIGRSLQEFLVMYPLEGNREDVHKFINKLIYDSSPIPQQNEPYGEPLDGII